MIVDEFQILGRGAGPCRVAPQRRDRRERAMRNEARLIPRVLDRKIQIRGGGHIQHRHLDRAQSRFRIAVEGWSVTHVVGFPRPHLQDQVIGIRAVEEFLRVAGDRLVERGARRVIRPPQFPPPPFLRIQPSKPHQ